jgi:hypothetical protein
MANRIRCAGVVNVVVDIVQKSYRARNERRAERGPRAGCVGTKGISTDNVLARSRDPFDL